MTEQGVLHQGKLIHLLIRTLLLLVCCSTNPAFTEPSHLADTLSLESPAKNKNVFIIYSFDNQLHSNIVELLTDKVKRIRADINIKNVSADEKIKAIDNNTDIIIGIGPAGMESANKYYPDTKKLFISTDPNKYILDSKKNKNDAILYMTQSYCRQIGFIRLLNKNWKTISILNSQKKPLTSDAIRQCANIFSFKLYIVSTTAEENITNKIKNALHHSDVLLALPDSNIYNSNSVKNILLTSYRYRKPVIAFSKNFVNAGALAGLYSSTEQIAQSASDIIEQYFYSDSNFNNSIYHPDSFEIDINRQVFKALEISAPDIDTLKIKLERQELDNPGKWQ